MQKEYSTIREVVGPLMLVDGVERREIFDELVEIEQQNGEVRLRPGAGSGRRHGAVATV